VRDGRPSGPPVPRQPVVETQLGLGKRESARVGDGELPLSARCTDPVHEEPETLRRKLKRAEEQVELRETVAELIVAGAERLRPVPGPLPREQLAPAVHGANSYVRTLTRA
jgi:hypothetical protein